MPIEKISDLVGHKEQATTETVYRYTRSGRSCSTAPRPWTACFRLNVIRDLALACRRRRSDGRVRVLLNTHHDPIGPWGVHTSKSKSRTAQPAGYLDELWWHRSQRVGHEVVLDAVRAVG